MMIVVDLQLEKLGNVLPWLVLLSGDMEAMGDVRPLRSPSTCSKSSGFAVSQAGGDSLSLIAGVASSFILLTGR